VARAFRCWREEVLSRRPAGEQRMWRAPSAAGEKRCLAGGQRVSSGCGARLPVEGGEEDGGRVFVLKPSPVWQALEEG